MRTSRTALLIALVGLVPVGFAADTFKLIHVDDLAALIATQSRHVWIYDANPSSVRLREGVIVGAKLLSSPSRYDIATELPAAKDDKLVFYCANTRCMASHEAARRAVEGGYTDVNVMSDGIMGWNAADQPTVTPE